MRIVTNVVHLRIIEKGTVRASAGARLNMDLLEKGNVVRIPFHFHCCSYSMLTYAASKDFAARVHIIYLLDH